MAGPGTVGVEGSTSVVNGQKIVIDPFVILGGYLIGNCYRQRDWICWPSGDEDLEVLPNTVGSDARDGDDQAVIAGIQAPSGKLGGQRCSRPAAGPGQEQCMRAGLKNAAVGELVAGVGGSCFAQQARSRGGQIGGM